MVDFNTRDVYHILNVALMEMDYHSLNIEEKRKAVTDCFNSYFAFKISQLHSNLLEREKCETPIDYLMALESIVEGDHMEKLSHPVHFLMGLISGLQGFEIIWEIDDSLDKPMILYDRILRQFATSKDVSIVDAFGILYDYFMTSPNLIPDGEKLHLSQKKS